MCYNVGRIRTYKIMKYQFNLEWNDLNEELREELITKYLEGGEGYPCDNCDGEGAVKAKGDTIITHLECIECKGKGKVIDTENLHHRDEAQMDIEARFPMYF